MDPAKRRFGIADLVFLVAAFAVAFAVCLFAKRHWDGRNANWSDGNTITFAWSSAGNFLYVFTVYLTAMILRRRPARREFVASRGNACVLSIFLVSLIQIPTNWDALFNSAVPVSFLVVMAPFSLSGNPLAGAGAAISAWLALNLASVPASETDWLDRAGKCTAFTWLIFAFAQPVLDLNVLEFLGVSFS